MVISLPTERPYARARTTPGEECVSRPSEEDGLTPGAIDIWRVDLGTANEGVEDLLDPGERARAAQIVRAEQRALWVRARGVLRTLLGGYLERDPRALRFRTGPYGKPALAGTGEPRFNLAHSGALMIVAVSGGSEVGVDVELARAHYTADFLRAWTRREAVVKCLGTGLAGAERTSLATTGDETRAGVDGDDARAGMRGEIGAGLWTTELDVGPGAYAALAVDQSPASQRSAPAS